MSYVAERPRLDRRVLVVMPALMLTLMLAVLDQTIVATALPSIAAGLGQFDQLTGVSTSYLLTSCVAVPLYGRLGDLFGRKVVFQAALVLFLLGSALCGFAQSMIELVLFRAVQGAGAGGLVVTVQATIGGLVAPAERGRYQGFLQAANATATLAGPLVGGFITQVFGWRWAFFANIPLGLVALTVVSLVLERAPRLDTKPSIDWRGGIVLSVGVASIVLVISEGGRVWPWSSGWLVALALVGIVLLMVFVRFERHAPVPMVPLHLFTNSVVRTCAGLEFLIGVSSLTLLTFVPVFQQVAAHSSPTASGLQLAPLVLAVLASSTITGQLLSRTGRYRAFPIAGALLLLTGLVLLAQVDLGMSAAYQVPVLIVAGAGFGMMTPVTLVAVQNAVSSEQIGVGTSVNNFSRFIGGSLGLTIFGAIFNAVAPAGSGTDLLPALRVVFLVEIAVAAGILVLALRLPEIPLRRLRDVAEK